MPPSGARRPPRRAFRRRRSGPATSVTLRPVPLALDAKESRACRRGRKTSHSDARARGVRRRGAAGVAGRRHARSSKPSSFAFETAADSPRALKEPVGLPDSSLIQRSEKSAEAPSRSARRSGVPPSPSETMFVGLLDRHHFAPPPDRARTIGRRVAIERTIVVPREERRRRRSPRGRRRTGCHARKYVRTACRRGARRTRTRRARYQDFARTRGAGREASQDSRNRADRNTLDGRAKAGAHNRRRPWN